MNLLAVAYGGVGSSYLNQFTWTWLIGKATDCKSVLGRVDSYRPLQMPDWCNGNTGDSKSLTGGSIPSSGAIFPQSPG